MSKRFKTTTISTIQEIADRWADQYYSHGDWRNVVNGSSQEIHESIITSKTLDDVDKAIGNKSWTTNHCSNCSKTTRKPMIVLDLHYSHDTNLCNKCVKRMFKQITKR